MSLLGPPVNDPSHEPKSTSKEQRPLEQQLAEVLSCLPVLRSYFEDKELPPVGAELMDALEALAVWLMEEGRPNDAVKAFEVATRFYPQDNRLRKCLAVALTAAGEHLDALVAWQKICERSSHDAENQLMLAQAFYVSGDISAARKSFQDWFSRWPDFDELPHGLHLPAKQWYRWLNPTL